MDASPNSAIANLIVEFDRVTYTHFGKTAPALTDVSLSIRRGSFTLLIGPSGSGKSTLCMILNGIIPHLLGGNLTGRVTVDGQPVTSTPVRDLARSVGLLFQDPELMFATLQAEDEVAFGPENLRLPRDEIIGRVNQALDYVGLSAERERLVWALSGGQVQKLGLAAVLAMRTPLVVLDEPTANLDPATTQSVHELILRLRREGTTVLLVTKELDEFIAEADDMIVLERGAVMVHGAPRRVLADHGSAIVDLGVWLPEPTEIGLRLAVRGYGERLSRPEAIPLTVAEATACLARARFENNTPTNRPPLAPGETLVRARDVHYAYGRKTPALRGVSFEIRRGEIVAIVGQNGAGKSTLSKLLVGLLKPQRGELTLFGRRADKWRVHDLANHVALVFQNPEHQFLSDTVFDELAYSLLAQGIDDPSTVSRSVGAMLERLDIADTSAEHPFALSAGAKRRLGVATMLVGGRPKLLIVDEPTYGQDKRMTDRLMQLITRLRDEGITIVMITHDMRLVEAHAERAIVMANGQITFDGPPDELFEAPEIVAGASLRTTALRRLIDRLRADGHPVPDGLCSVEAFVAGVTCRER